MKTHLLVGALLISSIAILGPFWSEVVLEQSTPTIQTQAVQSPSGVVGRQPDSKPTVRQPEQAPLNDSVLQDKQTALSQRQSELEQELQSLREELHLVIVKLDRMTIRDQSEDSTITMSEVEDLEIPETALIERLAQMDSILQAQSLDLSWSSGAEEMLSDSVEGFLVENGGELVDVECRQSVCRVESIHSDEQSLDAFLEEGFSAVQWDYEGVTEVEHHADGTSSVIMMVSREGYKLPLAEGG